MAIPPCTADVPLLNSEERVEKECTTTSAQNTRHEPVASTTHEPHAHSNMHVGEKGINTHYTIIRNEQSDRQNTCTAVRSCTHEYNSRSHTLCRHRRTRQPNVPDASPTT